MTQDFILNHISALHTYAPDGRQVQFLTREGVEAPMPSGHGFWRVWIFRALAVRFPLPLHTPSCLKEPLQMSNSHGTHATLVCTERVSLSGISQRKKLNA